MLKLAVAVVFDQSCCVIDLRYPPFSDKIRLYCSSYSYSKNFRTHRNVPYLQLFLSCTFICSGYTRIFRCQISNYLVQKARIWGFRRQYWTSDFMVSHRSLNSILWFVSGTN